MDNSFLNSFSCCLSRVLLEFWADLSEWVEKKVICACCRSISFCLWVSILFCIESREPRTSLVDLPLAPLAPRCPAELWSPWIKFQRFGREFSERDNIITHVHTLNDKHFSLLVGEPLITIEYSTYFFLNKSILLSFIPH